MPRKLLIKFAVSFAILFFFSTLASAQEKLKTKTVVLIVADGLRWQEVFTGADPTLMDSEHGGIWAKTEDLKRDYWRDDLDERRKLLFPFLWTTVSPKGQIFGNQTKGSVAHVTN